MKSSSVFKLIKQQLKNLALLSIPLIPTTALADETVATVLPEVVVTGTLAPTLVKNLPATVQVIGTEEIERSGAKHLGDIFERLIPGYFLAQPGAFQSFGMRGFNSSKETGISISDHVLILIDGNKAGIGNPSFFVLGNVERIEIVRGPSSVVYGGSASGGVINLITKRGQGERSGSIGFSGGSFDAIAGDVSVQSGLVADSLGYALALQSSHRDNYKSGDNQDYENTAYHNVAVSAIGTARGDKTELSLIFNHNSAYNHGSPGGGTFLTPNDSVDNKNYYTNIEFKHRFKYDIDLLISAFHTQNNYTFHDATFAFDKSNYEGKNTGARTITSIPTWDFGTFSLGAEYNINTLEHDGITYAPDVEYGILGLFAEQKIEIGDLSIVAGLRYDHYSLETKETQGLVSISPATDSFSHLTWRIGAVYWLTDWLGLRASAGTSFVAPTADKLAGTYATAFGSYIGNPNLEPEKSWTAEAGFEIDYKPINFSFAYFYTDYDNRIGLTPLDPSNPWGPQTYDNFDSQEISGLEFLASANFNLPLGNKELNIIPYFNGEYFLNRKDENNETIVDLPRYNFVAGLGLGTEIFVPVWLDFNARFTGHQESSFPDEYYKSFVIYNAKLTVTPFKNFDVYLDVDNLSNEDYAYKIGYPMPGLSMVLGFDYKF